VTVIGFHGSHEQVHPAALPAAVRHAEQVGFTAELGFDRVFLHHVGQEQTAFLDAFGEHVLPGLDVPAPDPAVAADPPRPDGPRRPRQVPQPAVLP
jgi:hypothetical protein